MTRRASETVIINSDRLAHQAVRGAKEVREHSRACVGCKIQLLVEVAVEQSSSPAHTDETSAHQRLDVFRAMGFSQDLLVRLKLTLMLQISGKPLDRHIGDGEQVGKRNPMSR